MDPVTNPYKPGAGRRPPLLAGREDLLSAFDVVRRRVNSSGWVVAKVEAGTAGTLPVVLN